MYEAMLKAIGIKLLQGRNCPHDPACVYGYGEHCDAEEDKLDSIIGEVMDRIWKERCCISIRPSEKGPWPCAEIIIVKFSDPDPD